MKLLQVVVVSLLVLGASWAEDELDSACNCDHCDESIIIGPSAEDDGGNPQAANLLHKEDADDDGNLEICARDRDEKDRTFSSVCHMLCHNRCTRYKVEEVYTANLKKYYTSAYRTNFYKLRDGEC